MENRIMFNTAPSIGPGPGLLRRDERGVHTHTHVQAHTCARIALARRKQVDVDA